MKTLLDLPVINSKEFRGACQGLAKRFTDDWFLFESEGTYLPRKEPMSSVRIAEDNLARYLNCHGYSFSYRKDDQTTDCWHMKKEWLERNFVKNDGLIVAKMDFLPGLGEVVDDPKTGANVINLWKPSQAALDAAAKGEAGGNRTVESWCHDGLSAPEWVERHVSWLCNGDPAVAGAFLDFMAHAVQRPFEKVLWGVILTSEAEGVGKDTLSELMGLLLEGEKRPAVSAKEITGQFTDWLFGRLWVQLDEIYESRKDRYLANALKKFITAPTAMIDRKYRDVLEVQNLARFFITSNADVPMAISERDRRWFVVRCDAIGSVKEVDPKTGQERTVFPEDTWRTFRALHDFVLEDRAALAQVYQWLAQRDIAGFDPKRPPMMTSAKAELIAESRPRAEVALEEILTDPKVWFSQFADKWVTRTEIEAWAKKEYSVDLSAVPARSFGSVLRGIGAFEVKRTRSTVVYRLVGAAELERDLPF